MDEDEWKSFIAEGTRTGKLATVRADGAPHIAPVWFLPDGDDLVFTTENVTVKAHDMLRDRRAAMCVDDGVPPCSHAVLWGHTGISEDPRELLDWATRIVARYMGEERAPEFGARNSVPGMLLVRMHVDRVSADAAIA
ncbi:PPOX class F420-dependent oxidoreductase [Streptomyces sulfonofaciens]|nr:PPOX class F420-dependent oxidoreductase [Streptomyces sulfonofaciens]